MRSHTIAVSALYCKSVLYIIYTDILICKQYRCCISLPACDHQCMLLILTKQNYTTLCVDYINLSKCARITVIILKLFS